MYSTFPYPGLVLDLTLVNLDFASDGRRRDAGIGAHESLQRQIPAADGGQLSRGFFLLFLLENGVVGRLDLVRIYFFARWEIRKQGRVVNSSSSDLTDSSTVKYSTGFLQL